MLGMSSTEYSTARLRALIQSVLDTGVTQAEIARRSGLPKSTVSAIATREHRTDVLPSKILESLADGLGVPYERVLQAALTDAGLTVLADDEVIPEAVLVTEAMKPMSADKRKRYAAMLLALAKEYREP